MNGCNCTELIISLAFVLAVFVVTGIALFIARKEIKDQEEEISLWHKRHIESAREKRGK